MIKFSDKRLYLKGTSQIICTDKATGDIVYFSNKFQTGNFTPSVTLGEIRAGIGNPIAAMIPSDASATVEFTAADFNLWMKSAQTGATLNYSAPVMVCQDVTASGASLNISVASGTPIANVGMDKIVCYVQEIGEASPLADGGKAYTLNPSTGAIAGFSATSGKQYKVWYYVSKAEAQIATISTMMNPKTLHCSIAMAVYEGVSGSSQNEGSRVGTLLTVIPNLKLNANGGVNGDQSNNDTTMVSGQAIAYDDTVVAAGTDGCSQTGAALAYYIYIPCSEAETAAVGVVSQVGGVISIPKSTTYQVVPKAIMSNNQVVPIDPAQCTYSLTGISGTSVSNSGLISAGSTAGTGGLLTVTYVSGGKTFKDTCDVAVTA